MAERAPRVLCVDDDSRVLDILARHLERRGFEVRLAGTSAEAHQRLSREPMDAALVDLLLGGEDGVALLAEIADASPATVRFAISGAADYQASVRAINEGRIFAFVEKPWDADALASTLRAGVAAADSAAARESLGAQDDEAGGATPIGADVWRCLEALQALEPPEKRGHGARVAESLAAFGAHLGLPPGRIREVQAAALVHDVGELLVPEAVRLAPEHRMTPEMWQDYMAHPATGRAFLARIPGLEGAAEIVALHHERYDGKGFPNGLRGTEIPAVVRVLAVVDAYDDALTGHIVPGPLDAAAARDYLEGEKGARLDPRAVTAYLNWLSRGQPEPGAGDGLPLPQLRPGMVLAEDLVTPDGLLLVPAGHRLNASLIQRIAALTSSFPQLRAMVRG